MKVILFIIIIFFVFAGYFSANLFTNDGGTVAEVDGITISNAEIDEVIARQRRANANFDQQYPTEASKAALRLQIREQLINDRVVTSSIAQTGLTASKSQITTEVRKVPQFQVNGVYDPEMAKTILAQNNVPYSEFENRIRAQITRDQFNKSVSDSGFTLDQEIETFYRIQEQTRDAKLVKIPQAKFAEGISLEEAEIQTYYEQNAAEFAQAEKVKIDYILVSKDQLASQIKAAISDEQIAEFYQQNKNQYIAPDKIQVAHILITNDEDNAEQKATDLLTQITNGADFAELAKEHSADTFSAQNGGVLDTTDAAEGNSGWVPEFEAAALALTQAGELSEVVKTDFGYHIIKLVERSAGDVQELVAVSDTIKDRLANEQAESEFFSKQATLNDAIFSTETIAELAKTAGLTLASSGWFEQGQAPVDLNHPALLEQAFSSANIQSKEISDEIKLSDQSIAYIVVTDYQAEGTKPLAEVSQQIRDRLTQAKAAEAAKEFAEKVKLELEAGKDVAELLATKELTWIESSGFASRDAALDPALLQALFKQKAPVDAPTIAVDELTTGDYALVELRKVNYPDLSKLDEAKKNQYKLQLAYFNSQGDLQSLLKELREKADIK